MTIGSFARWETRMRCSAMSVRASRLYRPVAWSDQMPAVSSAGSFVSSAIGNRHTLGHRRGRRPEGGGSRPGPCADRSPHGRHRIATAPLDPARGAHGTLRAMPNGASTTPATTPATPPGRGGRRLRVLLADRERGAARRARRGLGFGSLVWAQRELDKGDVTSRENPETGEKIIGGPCVRRACNYLLLGSDSRTGLSHEDQVISGTNADLGGEQRADTIMLIHVDPDREQAVILSFPRDLWVPVPGHGMDKINSAFEGGVRGGGADVARTVEDLTGLHINHFLYVDLAGFQGVVDALGGVRMRAVSDAGRADRARRPGGLPGVRRGDGARLRQDTAPALRRRSRLRAHRTPAAVPAGRAHEAPLPERGREPSGAREASRLQRREGRRLPDPRHHRAGAAAPGREYRRGRLPRRAGPAGADQAAGVPVRDQRRLGDAAGARAFRDLREGRSLGDVGHELAQTAISEANIEAAVYDKNSDGGAHAVEGARRGRLQRRARHPARGRADGRREGLGHPVRAGRRRTSGGRRQVLLEPEDGRGRRGRPARRRRGRARDVGLPAGTGRRRRRAGRPDCAAGVEQPAP